MSLIKRVDYEPWKGINFIQEGEEGRIIALLKDVRDSAALLRSDLANQRLDIILEVIEKGEWVFQEKVDPKKTQVESNYLLDLSKAKNLVSQYRHNSEGGCQSCVSRRVYNPLPGENFTYCNKVENEAFAINNWSINNIQSPTIKEFYETGCSNKKPIISRKLEEVLKEHKNE